MLYGILLWHPEHPKADSDIRNGMERTCQQHGSGSKSVTRRCYDVIYRYRGQKGKNNSEGAELNFCF